MTSWLSRHPLVAGVVAVVLLLGTFWAVQLAGLARDVDRYADHWSQPQGQAGGLLYVALGDSAAQGIGASAPEKGYVGLLAERLRRETGRPVEVVNLSSAGARVADVLDTQLPALAALGRAPDVLTVGIGGNDVRDYDRDAFAAQVRELTARLPSGAYVADVPYYMHGRWERHAAEAARALTAAAGEEGMRLVPLHDALRDLGWSSMLTHFAADWFHPNDRGHRVWADAFWGVVEADLPAR